MTPRKIKAIVIFMCLSLIGLVTFQWYWIREALAIQNDRFNDKVAEAVQNVAHKLEKQEIVYLLQRRREDEIQKERLRQMSILARKKNQPNPSNEATQSPNERGRVVDRRNVIEEGIPLPHRNRGLQSDALVPSFHHFIEREQQFIEEFFKARQMGIAGIEDFMLRRMQEQILLGDLLENSLGQVREEVSRAENQPQKKTPVRREAPQRKVYSDQSPPIPKSTQAEELLREVIEEIVYTKRPIHERVNRFLLDSLLKNEFIQNGIELPFSFAVRPVNHPHMLFSTADIRPYDWERKAHKAILFPGSGPESGGLLYVYFPGKRQYVLEKTAAIMTGSAILVIVLMVCFYLAVTTILKQKKLSDIKNDFINNMTHELKTPISTIGLAVDMAAEKAQLVGNPDITRYMDIIGTENKRLGDQVERVLRMAQMDRGNLELKRDPVNVHDLIEKALNSLYVQIESRNGELLLDYLADHETVTGDPVHLTNVIYNLVDNAIKYSSDQPHIEIKTQNEDQGVVITVTDRGIGLNKDQISRIFERFYRVPTGNLHDVKGFGLGLSYVKEIVEAHGGKISVKSQKGVGSSFSVWLPFTQEHTLLQKSVSRPS